MLAAHVSIIVIIAVIDAQSCQDVTCVATSVVVDVAYDAIVACGAIMVPVVLVVVQKSSLCGHPLEPTRRGLSTSRPQCSVFLVDRQTGF